MASFEDLRVYRRAIVLADAVFLAVSQWENLPKWTVGVQLVRAADSIAANIAEAYGRGSVAEHRRFLIIARGSANEATNWVARADARDLQLPPGTGAESERIGRMLSGLINSLAG